MSALQARAVHEVYGSLSAEPNPAAGVIILSAEANQAPSRRVYSSRRSSFHFLFFPSFFLDVLPFLFLSFRFSPVALSTRSRSSWLQAHDLAQGRGKGDREEEK